MAARSPRRTARTVGTIAERREWTIASDVQAITPIVDTVQALCAAAGFSDRHCGLNIPVAMTEALSNAILRGNGCDLTRCVLVAVTLEAQRLVVDVTDEGDGFDFDAVLHSPDDADWLEREDGRGLFLIQSLMDEVHSLRAERQRGHTLRLVLHRA